MIKSHITCNIYTAFDYDKYEDSNYKIVVNYDLPTCPCLTSEPMNYYSAIDLFNKIIPVFPIYQLDIIHVTDDGIEYFKTMHVFHEQSQS